MNEFLRSFKLDKSSLSVGSLHDPSDERAFWASKTPHEHLAALEFLRAMHYGYDPSTARLQGVLTVSQLGDG